MTKEKSKTQTYKFTGTAYWAKVYDPDEFRGSKDWKIDVALDDESVALYKRSGIQSKLKETENGLIAKFKRPQVKLIKGVSTLFHGPRVIDKDGNPIVDYEKNEEGTDFVRKGEPVLIGNGSKVEVTVNVYETSMGPGQRMDSIKILDLIEYTPDGGGFRDAIVVGGSKPADNKAKAPW